MTITSGTQLLQHIDAGKHFGFNDQGQVKTFNLWNRFTQSVGDFFGRSREQIEERDTRLQNTMTNMLRNDGVFPNLSNNIATLPLKATVQNAMIARTEMVDQLKSFPSAMRPEIREMVMERLRNNGIMDAIDPSVVRTGVKACIRELSMSPQVVAKAALTNLPASVAPHLQSDFRNAAMTLLRENGTLNEHDPAVVRAAVKALVKELSTSPLKDIPSAAQPAMKEAIAALWAKEYSNDTSLLAIHRFTKNLVQEFSTPAMLAFFSRVKQEPTPQEKEVMTQIMHKALLTSFKPENITAHGLHESFSKDAEKFPITIDGTATTANSAAQELMDAIPQKFLPFVSTLLSDSGMTHCLERYMDNKEWDTTKYPVISFSDMITGVDDIVTEDFRLPSPDDLKKDKIITKSFHYEKALNTGNNDDYIISQYNTVNFTREGNHADLGTHHYDISILIPKEQKEEDFSAPMLPKHTVIVKMHVVDQASQNKGSDAS